jgi:hypothetical protein
MARYNRPLVRLIQTREFRVDRHGKLLDNDNGLLSWDVDEQDLVDEAQYERILALRRLVELQLYYRHVARGEERRRAALAFRAVVVNLDYAGYDAIFFPDGRELRMVERDGRWQLEPHPHADDSDAERWERLRPFLEALWTGLAERKHRPFGVQEDFVRQIALEHGVHPRIALEHVAAASRANVSVPPATS